jgi:hypothetical protein
MPGCLKRIVQLGKFHGSDTTSWFAQTFNSLLFLNRMDSKLLKGLYNRKIQASHFGLEERFKDIRMRGAVLFSNTRMKKEKAAIENAEQEKKQQIEKYKRGKNELMQKHNEEIEVVRQTLHWCNRQTENEKTVEVRGEKQ